ncbi:MAG TPA: 7TM diverse intracellular signaling domain-containing protein, partial [Chitinophagaceae bacterium]|nr:7TM diverse intracellular signaling domain-containing protein [Chitinophagaceae bacterium]
KPVGNFGMTPSPYWIKCTLRNETREKLYLELGNPTLTDVQLYEFDSSGVLINQHHSGNWLPFKKWENKDLNYRIALSAPPHTTETIFIRVQHYRGTQFTLIAGTESALNSKSIPRRMFEMIYYGMMAVMVLYNFFIYLSLRDKAYLYYVLYTFLMTLLNAVVNGDTFKYLWPGVPALNHFIEIITCSVTITSILFAIHFLLTRQNASRLHKVLRTLIVSYAGVLLVIIAQRFVMEGNMQAMTFLFAFIAFITFVLIVALLWAGVVVLRSGYQPAKFYLVAWSFLLVCVIIFILKDFNLLPYNFFTLKSMQIGSAGEALLLSMALANRINLLKKEKEEAQLQTVRSLEENEKLIKEQNVILEKKVEERTQELKQANTQLMAAVQDLEETQTQLFQREKMASLGELTAGIAHEIQNPLNFINNFSEVNSELIGELKQEISKGNTEVVLSLADTLDENEQKINRHGKRASSIVKGMLQHSRVSTGQKEPTDINTLVDEYLKLSYHGMRAKDKTFNVELQTDFDPGIGKVAVAPQEIGRVLINLFNNAFYAVQQKQRSNSTFEPLVTVITSKVADKVVIHVKDNGIGIPQKIVDKIFQPFFTTKPSGEGTGLGLSLSYDIVTKGHGGELKVTTKEGEFTDVKVVLPTTISAENAQG